MEADDLPLCIKYIPSKCACQQKSISVNWNLTPNGYVKVPLYGVAGNATPVARLLLDAGENEAVFYKDPEDKTNLRTENLEKRPSKMGTVDARKTLKKNPLDKAPINPAELKGVSQDLRFTPNNAGDNRTQYTGSVGRLVGRSRAPTRGSGY